MINDDTFRIALDAALKAQKIHKKERSAAIEKYMLYPLDQRDDIIDIEESKARQFLKKEEVPSEHDEQVNFINYFRHQFPDVKIFAIPNGGSRNIIEARKLKAEGVLDGVSDLFIPAWLCWVEMKRIKYSAWSQEQQDWKKYVESIGQTYLLAYGCEHAKKLIQTFYINKYNL